MTAFPDDVGDLDTPLTLIKRTETATPSGGLSVQDTISGTVWGRIDWQANARRESAGATESFGVIEILLRADERIEDGCLLRTASSRFFVETHQPIGRKGQFTLCRCRLMRSDEA